ncbi:glycosyltransferase family 2 protein [Polynucleobacter sp. AM-25C3]|uniref:glycosyltransferase family 2 protein n=1 Tax=Polynucleobacter sp. AM-25C3 TaxID=1855569 RepID=UPI001C0D7DC0|nr:glycosyltransferase family 2 protein [Polynucleobacter sp. AM-25C3]MBU3601785.1 glycosyltransferase family 2 protein [Polynucleobacter sp. AM-25C3]
MRSDDILSVIVSYNDAFALQRCVDSVLSQTGYVHIVDNNSNPEVQNALLRLQAEEGLSICKFPENRGIASALNEGVRRAQLLGCKWLLTMDQDSALGFEMIQLYCDYLKKNPQVVSLTPSIQDLNRRHVVEEGGVVEYAISSGNLVRVDVFDKIGLYNDALFIDSVDFEFSLRLRAAGMMIHRVENAKMAHRLGGTVGKGNFLKRFYTNHSPTRRYYMARNTLYLIEWYGMKFPLFMLRLLAVSLCSFAAIIVYGPERMESIRCIVLGVFDYARRRLGSIRRR